MESTQDKWALVTGGNRGIGFAIAQGLLAKGYSIIITSRSLDNAKLATQKLQPKVIPLELDVRHFQKIKCPAVSIIFLAQPRYLGAFALRAKATAGHFISWISLTDDRSIHEAVKTLHQKIDRLDVLINNA